MKFRGNAEIVLMPWEEFQNFISFKGDAKFFIIFYFYRHLFFT